MKIEDVKRVLIIGSGTMGQEIGLQSAMYGYQVTYYDIAPEMLEKAAGRIQAILAGFVAGGHLSQEQADAVLARITYSTDPQAAAHEVDLVSESVPEDPTLKTKIFAQFNALCPPRTIFTTNTSSLIPSLIAEATGRPAQFAALHFHHEVWVSNVVDVMPHAGTNAETVELLIAFAKRIGQIPIVSKKENYGYVFNAMYNALNREAITLAANGIASVEDIDRAWMGVMKMPLGPFGMLDGVGLDTAWHITQYWANTLNDPQLKINADFLKTYVDQGFVGIKNGRGFYSYPDPLYARPEFLLGE
ncbi:MAG: 3-hydroxyacyl-CoA dehydrogenase [Chloroflexota bacterium]